MNLLNKDRSPVLCGILTAVLILLPCIPMTGCTQAQVVKAVTVAVAGLQKAQALMPDARTIIAEVQALDPEYAGQLSSLADQGDKILAQCVQLGQNYLNNPGDGAFQALLNGVSLLASQANADSLKTIHISNPVTQAKVETWLKIFVTGLTAVDVALKTVAKPAQVQAIPTATASLRGLKPWIDHDYAVRLLNEAGYDGEKCLKAAGL